MIKKITTVIVFDNRERMVQEFYHTATLKYEDYFVKFTTFVDI